MNLFSLLGLRVALSVDIEKEEGTLIAADAGGNDDKKKISPCKPEF